MKQYAYGGKPWTGPICALFFGGIAYFCYSQGTSHANFDYKGLHYEGDTAFYLHMGLAGISLLFALGGLAVIFQQLSVEQKFIEVTPLDITMPKLLFKDKTTIRFADIVKLQEQKIHGNYILTVKSAQEKIDISSVGLKDKANYEEIKTQLAAKMPRNRP